MTQENLDQLTFTINEADNIVCFENAHLKAKNKKGMVRSTVNLEEFKTHELMCQILIDGLKKTGQLLCANVGQDYFKLGVFEPDSIENHYLPVNASQLSLLLIFSFQMKELELDTVLNWGQEILNAQENPETKEALFACLHQYHKEITALSIQNCQVLTYEEEGQFLPAIIKELFNLAQANDFALHFNFKKEHDLCIVGYPERYSKYKSSNAPKESVKLDNSSMLYHVLTHYEITLELPPVIHYKWIDSVIKRLESADDRQVFYGYLNQWVRLTPTNAMKWLLMQYRDDKEKLQEIIKYVPQYVVGYSPETLKELFHLFLHDLPEYQSHQEDENGSNSDEDDIVDSSWLMKYLWFNRQKINRKHTEKSEFFNFLKDEYPDLIEKLYFLNGAQRYHELGQTGNLFEKKYHFSALKDNDAGMELILNFKAVHEMLLLKQSGVKEIEKWFRQKVFPYIQGNDLMNKWEIQYLSYNTNQDDDGLIRLYWKGKPQFTKEMMQKSLNEFFLQIRQENPNAIEEVSMDYPKWFSACWLRLKLDYLMKDDDDTQNSNDETKSSRLKI